MKYMDYLMHKKSEEYEEIVVNYLNTEFIPRFSDKK